MKKGQDTRGYERYLALDIPGSISWWAAGNKRRIGCSRRAESVSRNLASRVLVVKAAEVWGLAGARVKTDKEDIQQLLKLLVDGIVPEVRERKDYGSGLRVRPEKHQSVGKNADPEELALLAEVEHPGGELHTLCRGEYPTQSICN
jgi:hypothetical protein